ncbi:MAG: DEAD/DEAH box helicase [Treponema sp.]|jgi:superfamily II DNA/RNA helicase|nr:DEAD/DEAH box helicase [Treponema sp.]
MEINGTEMELKIRFSDMGIRPFFVEKLSQRNINDPTDIQKLVIPRVRNRENILFRSATGTGKTFAYLLPLFENLYAAIEAKEAVSSPHILILAPTLELCSQLKQEADFLLRDSARERQSPPPPRVGLLIGSANITRQIETIRKEKPAVIVGNSARVLQLVRMGKLKLGAARTGAQPGVLALDEADRFVANETIDETRELIGRMHVVPQVIACSATMPEKTRERLRTLFGEFGEFGEMAYIETEEQEILRERITHWAFFSEDRKKLRCLCSFLNAIGASCGATSRRKKCLVFTSRTGQVGNIVAQLQYHGISADGLASGMDKQARRRALDNFRQGKLIVLVSSDLAARGLDIPDISYCVALDAPFEADAYIHRAGRTARAGKRGCMVTIGNEEELRRFSILEKKLGITVYPKILYQGRIENPC